MSDCGLISIIILNYNGYSDTLECLSSLKGMDCSGYRIILIDNGSTDNSVSRIVSWCQKRFTVHSTLESTLEKNALTSPFNNHSAIVHEDNLQLHLIANTENRGFAAGCNQGIRLALSLGSEYIWLLNNDTTVETNALSVMVNYLKKQPSCQVVTPQIRLFDEPERIWNCGGTLKWYGARKYFFVHSPARVLPDKEKIDITFVTGCAPLIRSILLQKMGGFTEKFFFGEEDFEFSLRMKKAGVKMVCCLRSKIYHKVGMSIDRSSSDSNLGKIYIYYLNRFINLRSFWPYSFWYVWRLIYCIYIYTLLGRNTDCPSTTRHKFIKKLLQESQEMNGVDRQTFLKILNDPLGHFQQT